MLALLPLWWPPSTARRALATLRGLPRVTAGGRSLLENPRRRARQQGEVVPGPGDRPVPRSRPRPPGRSRPFSRAHSTDLWGLLLATVGLLAAIAIFGDSLGPVGHGVRVASGDLFGTGRFALPLAFLAAGVLLVAGRSTEREPVRAGLGLVLALWAVSGLAAAAGGAPGLSAPEHELAGAGGLLGAVVCDPLRAGLGTLGASVVLLAVLGCALVVLTGVGLRSAAVGVAAFARFSWQHLTTAVRSISQMGEVVVKVDGEKLSPSRDVDIDFDIDGDIEGYVEPPPPIPLDDPEEELVEEPAEEVRPAVSEAPVARPLPTRPSRQLELDLGLATGQWRLPHVGHPRALAGACDRPRGDSRQPAGPS